MTILHDKVIVNRFIYIIMYYKKVDFRTRLKDEMVFSDIQHKELAARACITPRALLSYVSSHPSMPPADAAVRIAKVLGVSVEYLVTGDKRETGEVLSQREHELVYKFDKLSVKEQNAVIALIEKLADEM